MNAEKGAGYPAPNKTLPSAIRLEGELHRQTDGASQLEKQWRLVEAADCLRATALILRRRVEHRRQVIWSHRIGIERHAIADESPVRRTKGKATLRVNLLSISSDRVLVEQVGERGREAKKFLLAQLIVLLEVKVALHVPRSAKGLRSADGDKAGGGILGNIDPSSAVHWINRPCAAAVSDIRVGTHRRALVEVLKDSISRTC
jgi:hypothetical protein